MNVFASLAGASFRPSDAQEIVLGLQEGDTLSLEREPDNPYDGNAVKVIAYGEHIGYVERGVCLQLAQQMDKGVTVTCEVSMLVDSDKRSQRLKPLLKLDYQL